MTDVADTDTDTDDYVRTVVEDGIAWLTLNDPTKLNPVTPARIRRLNSVVAGLSGRADVHVIVVSGAGRGFCSGADLSRSTVRREPLPPGSGSTIGPESLWTLVSAEQPVIAMVNGPAVGYGCELALQADIRIASSDAVFGLPFSRLATTSDTGAGTWLLPRLVGFDRAAELFYTGRLWSAVEAYQMGMLLAVTSTEELRAETARLARTVADNSDWSLRATKKLLWRGLEQSHAEHLLMQHTYQEAGDPTADRGAYLERFRRRGSTR